MKILIKTSLLSVGILSVLGLTACQSNPQQAKSDMPHKGAHYFNKDDARHWKAHARLADKDRSPRHAQLTAEQRAEFEKKRTERLAQFKAQRDAITQACEGKVGQNIAVKIGDKTINGSCEVQFRPARPERPTPKIQKETIQPVAPQASAS